ncbi:uncharacterized protein LOC144121323 [Amblyomma americanum]
MPDLDKSWGRAFVACAAIAISSASQSSSGFFYVTFMREYSLNHEKGSWLTSVFQAMLEGSALFAFALQKKFSISTIGLIGSVLIWSGILACQWAPNITWMTFTFGFLQGSGCGIVAVAVTVLLMRYFDKYRATATGIRYAGNSLSSLIYPPLLSHLYATFSFRQMFLLLGGISLNLTPLVYALRQPNLRPKSLSEKKNEFLNISKYQTRTSAYKVGSALGGNTINSDRQVPKPVAEKNGRTLEKRGSAERISSIAISVCHTTVASTGFKQCPQSVAVISKVPDQHIINQVRNTADVNAKSKCENEAWDKEANPPPLSTLLVRPAYWVFVFGAVLVNYSDHVFLGTIVDSALDHGATPFEADMATVCTVPSQLFGRTLLPFLADAGFANRTTLAGACYLLFAATIALLGVTRTFSAYALCAAAAWIFLGCLTTMKHVVTADHFGVEAVSAAWATTGLFVVPMLFCNPAILGFFRDKQGSYNNLYYSVASLHFTMSVAFFLLRCSTLKRPKIWKIEHQDRTPSSKSNELSVPAKNP